VRTNVSVALQYLDNWLRGTGAAAINDLMEDVATAEISRSQLWQWNRHAVRTAEGDVVDAELLRRVMDEELDALGGPATGRLETAADLLRALVLEPSFAPFLTPAAYPYLD
jgi:malate synthase